MFIALEGIDGAGKTTFAKYLVHHLKQAGFRADFVDSTGFEPIGKVSNELAADPQHYDCTAHLFLSHANSLVLIKSKIIPCLKRGDFIILDRYFPSAIAYSYAMGLDFDWLCHVSNCLLSPNYIIYFDVSATTALARKKSNGLNNLETNFSSNTDSVENDFLAFQNRVREGYAKLFQSLDFQMIYLDEKNTIGTNLQITIKKLSLWK